MAQRSSAPLEKQHKQTSKIKMLKNIGVNKIFVCVAKAGRYVFNIEKDFIPNIGGRNEFAISMRHETVLSKIGFCPKPYKPYLFLYRRSEKSIKFLEIIKFPKNITFLVHKYMGSRFCRKHYRNWFIQSVTIDQNGGQFSWRIGCFRQLKVVFDGLIELGEVGFS